MANPIDRTLSIAPMMGCTDRHCRYLFRLISPHAFNFTEMIVSGALIHGDTAHFLQHAGDEPCAMQIGGSNPSELADCAALVEAAGYQEINLNVGCPSDRVQYGGIGACLMAEPQLVSDCVKAMQDKVSIPVTVKCRIGIDDMDSFEAFSRFIEIVSNSGCDVFYVHARKAILQGLSPKENREIPPLHYDYVYRIQETFPELDFYLNGGLTTVSQVEEELQKVKGVMLGRAPYKNPYLLAELESALFGTQVLTRFEVVDEYVRYGLEQADHPKHLLKHLLGLFTGCPGARQFRRFLSDQMFDNNIDMTIVYEALNSAGLTAESIEAGQDYAQRH